MKRAIALLIAGIISASVARAGEVKITVTLTDSAIGESMTTFPTDTPKLYALFKTKGLKDGDKLRGVWVAIDVGDAAPPNTKINEKTLDAEGDTDDGEFTLSKPTKGWPVGKYKLEIYVNDQLNTTIKFAIEGGKSTKKDAADGDSSAE
jgi:outer membrane usher protein FimD/PapC